MRIMIRKLGPDLLQAQWDGVEGDLQAPPGWTASDPVRYDTTSTQDFTAVEDQGEAGLLRAVRRIAAGVER